jgi:hypothetical protein
MAPTRIAKSRLLELRKRAQLLKKMIASMPVSSTERPILERRLLEVQKKRALNLQWLRQLKAKK